MTKSTNPSILKWFSSENCTGFEIIKRASISDPKEVAKKIVVDKEISQKLMKRIMSLPVEGEKMISFAGSASVLDILFRCEPKKEPVIFINGKIKTPATSFYAGSNAEADLLYHDFSMLLMADYGKPVMLIKHLAQEYPDFKITFNGSEKFDGGPATVTGSTASFLVKDKTGTEQTLKVSSGQLPPQPVKFRVNNQEHTLYTYRSPKNEDLYPDHIQID